MATQSKTTKHQTTDQVAGKAHEAVDAAAETAGRAEERLRDSTDDVRGRSDDILNSVAGYVKENPLTSLGLAFAAGTILSSLTRR